MEENLASQTVMIDAADLDTLYGYAACFLAVRKDSKNAILLTTMTAAMAGITPEIAEDTLTRLEPTIFANIAAGYSRKR